MMSNPDKINALLIKILLTFFSLKWQHSRVGPLVVITCLLTPHKVALSLGKMFQCNISVTQAIIILHQQKRGKRMEMNSMMRQLTPVTKKTTPYIFQSRKSILMKAVFKIKLNVAARKKEIMKLGLPDCKCTKSQNSMLCSVQYLERHC